MKVQESNTSGVTTAASWARMLCAAGLVVFLAARAHATTIRVGPGEKIARVSQISHLLKPGDVVEITGDITDSFELTCHATKKSPITVRGVTRVDNGRIVRPRVTLNNTEGLPGIACKGNWNVLEGLDISGALGTAFQSGTAINISCDSFLLRNCCVHGNKQGVYSNGPTADNIDIEFCEFYSNGEEADPKAHRHTIYLLSEKPGACAIMQHCYLHDGTGGYLFRSRLGRTVVRYNWFESGFEQLVITSNLSLDDRYYPSHGDVVGNVFDSGRNPYMEYGYARYGGESEMTPGPEGTCNIAYNLFIAKNCDYYGFDDPSNLIPGKYYAVLLFCRGNVDRLRIYNNIFTEYGVSGSVMYDRETEAWDTPRTRAFVARRGSPDPVLEGSNNWVSTKNKLRPQELKDYVVSAYPGFVNTLDGDFHPGSDSPLAHKALATLPKGAIVDLTPEYEPQRGIPADLAARKRTDAGDPSIGPFQCASVPAELDDATKMVLDAESTDTWHTWELPYGQMCRMAERLLKEGKPDKALEAAKAQFIIGPTEEPALTDAIKNVKAALTALDANSARAERFERYALHGPGQEGGPDAKDPLAGVPLAPLPPPEYPLDSYDKMIDERISVWGAWQVAWYETEKGFARLECGRFDDGLGVLLSAYETAYKGPAEAKDALKRIRAGLSVAYRARYGTIAGFNQFMKNLEEYVVYGPAGKDGQMGTADDLQPPV